jgi:4-carboxymuconolactone decarboxylase
VDPTQVNTNGALLGTIRPRPCLDSRTANRTEVAVPRVPQVRREDLDPDGQAAYDEIAESRGKVQGGPFSVLLHRPELALRTARLGAYARYEAPMPARQRHLIALIASSATACAYEFTVHAALARTEGVADETIAAIGRGEEPGGLAGVDAAVARFAHQLIRDHRVDDATFAEVRDAVGLAGLTDIVGAAAYFTLISFPLNAFAVEVREGQVSELPAPPA